MQVRPVGWATNGFWFQVIGTNRTLTQRVVFEGNFLNELAVKPKMSAGPPAVKAPVKAEKQLAGPKKIEALPRLRIQGRAQVGRLKYDVDARNALSPHPAKAAPAKLDEDSPLPKK